MEYIPLTNNIGLSLGELIYDDIQIISDMLHDIEDVLLHSKRKRGWLHKYIILYKAYKCNMKNRTIICYAPNDTFLIREIINKPFYIANDTLEIKEIIKFHNQHKIIS